MSHLSVGLDVKDASEVGGGEVSFSIPLLMRALN